MLRILRGKLVGWCMVFISTFWSKEKFVTHQVVYVGNITWNAGGMLHVTPPVYTCTECYEHIVTDSDDVCRMFR